MDAVFKALSDDTRRQLLDMLNEKDGQTLTELEAKLGMTRFGVMKHLKILEEASLVVTRKSGRFKYHYLNAVPLQEVIDRWIDPLVQKPMARGILDLKAELEGNATMTAHAEKPDFVLETYIKTTVEKLWNSLTKAEQVPHYHFAPAKPSAEMETGKTVDYILPDGSNMLTFKVTEATPMTRIDMVFEPHFFGPGAPSSRCVYEIEPVGDVCKLTILHFDIHPGQEGVAEGWSRLAASLKSYLETGKGLSFPEMA